MSAGRLRKVLPAAAALLAVCAVVAWAYWTAPGSGTASATTGALAAAAIDVPASATNSLTVTLTQQASIESAANEDITYSVERSRGGGAWAAVSSGGCSGVKPYGTTACTDTPPGNDNYSYRVVASYATWTATSAVVGPVAFSDTSGPTGGSVDATGLAGPGGRYSVSTTLSIALAKGTDPSGVAASGAQLRRSTATLTSGSCGGYGVYTQVGASDPVSPVADTVPAAQACYRYEYVVADTLGNSTTYTSPDIKVETMPTGGTPTANVSGTDVTVSWPERTFGGTPVGGYVVKRYNNGGTLQSIGSACSGTIAALSCTEASVPAGTWKYTVTPVQDNWTGTESSMSSPVSVSPTLTITSSTTVTSLPATLSGTIDSYAPGQTVTYRLDDPTTGTVLSGSITPSPVPGSGTASVSVTVPAGTTNGSHTIYAVGSGGDTDAADITVNVTYSIATSAWDMRDASSGGAVLNGTAGVAFASDAFTLATTIWSNAFSASRYMEFDMNNPLPADQNVTGATFNFRRAANAAGNTTCFYFEVRRISTGVVLPAGTHGSSGSPVSCITGTTQVTTNTPLPEVTSTALANDVRIRLYAYESGSQRNVIDLATVTGTAGTAAFTLHPTRWIDAADSTPATTIWQFAALDGTPIGSTFDWLATFSTTRWVESTYPAYAPAGATISNVKIEHSYRPVISTQTACYYGEARLAAGGSLLGTYGSSTTPQGCSTGTSYKTESYFMPEVNTVAEINNLNLRLYFRVTGANTNRKTQHDHVRVTFDYSG